MVNPIPTDEFDPYHKWLGIPMHLRPPTYYQLLAISPKEQSDEVIITAATRQSNFVKEFKTTEYAEMATTLLYEIDEAKVCLLNRKIRREYDEKLAVSQKNQKGRSAKHLIPGYSPSPTVGEESGLVHSFAGIVSVILAAFIIMAVVTFWLPWQKVVFSRKGVVRDEQPQQAKARAAIPQNVDAQNVVIPKDVEARQQVVGPNEPIELATIGVTITAVDAPARLVTISRNSKTTTLDVSRSAEVSVDGRAAELESVRPGQAATIEFNPEFDVAMKIEVTGGAVSTAAVQPTSQPSEVSRTDDPLLAVITATIIAVDAASRSVTVSRNSKMAVFEVSRKSEIILNGEAGTLDLLSANQQATITFDPKHDIIAKIEITSKGSGVVQPANTHGDKSDELATIQATVTAVDLEQRSITVTRNAKTTTFDLSRRTEVLIDGQSATLDSLRTDLPASITFNPEFNVVVKIEMVVQP